MSQLSILRILPLLTLTFSLAAFAKDVTPIVPMTMGHKYTGSLTPSSTNPHGEVCYGLSVEPDTRITLKVKTGGIGIVKFALYDKTKGLRFFHNDVSSKSQAEENTLTDSRFSFPAVSEVSQLCLTTTNLDRGQPYDFTATATPGRRSKSRIVVRPMKIVNTSTISRPKHSAPASKRVTIQADSNIQIPPPPKGETSANIQMPPPPPVETITKIKIPPPPVETITKVKIPPPPSGEPYCYVGAWQIADLSAYWLPAIRNFTQAKVTDPQMLGYAKITINKDGNAVFEAFDLEQKYTLKVKETGARIDQIGLGVSGSATTRFQVNPDSTLTFRSQNYQRLSPKLNLGANLKLTGDRLFMLFGDRDLPPIKSQYKCLDRDNITLQILLPGGQKSIPIVLKRIN
jgi:hypothetical protein